MQVYIGLDWSSQKHDLQFVNEAGVAIAKRTIAHSLAGFEELEQLRQKLGLLPSECVVGLETAHHLLLDFLWARGYSQVYIVPPHRTALERTSLHRSGAYTDQSDAYLIANLVRTKVGVCLPWQPDGVLIQQMRRQVSLGLELTTQVTRLRNRLSSVLQRYYPAALQVFSGLDNLITLAFIQAYPSPQAAAELSLEAFTRFAQAQHYSNPRLLARNYARLQQSYPQALESICLACAPEAQVLARLLSEFVQAKNQQLKDLWALFQQHPDQATFASLPGVGKWLAPALLSKVGEDRRRFPEDGYLQGLAGSCPVTQASGKRRRVIMRHACDHEFRQFVQQWARASVPQSSWAAAYFERCLQRGMPASQAYRALGNRWLHILWKLWQNHQVYDEGYHLRQCALRSRPKLSQ